VRGFLFWEKPTPSRRLERKANSQKRKRPLRIAERASLLRWDCRPVILAPRPRRRRKHPLDHSASFTHRTELPSQWMPPQVKCTEDEFETKSARKPSALQKRAVSCNS